MTDSGMEYADEVEEVRYKAIKEFEYLDGTMLNEAEKQQIITDIVEFALQTKYD